MADAYELDRSAILRNYRARLLRELAEVDLLIAGVEAERQPGNPGEAARLEPAFSR